MVDPRVQRGQHAFRRLAVPQIRRTAPRPPSTENLADFVANLTNRREAIGALGDGDRALGRVTNRQTRNSEISRLLLDTTRVGDNKPRVADKAHELDIAEWL